MARAKKRADQVPSILEQRPLYTLEVIVIGGPITERFAKENPIISRTIQIRGNQTDRRQPSLYFSDN